MQKSTLINGGQIIIVADQSRRWILLLWPMALVFFVATLLPLTDSVEHILDRPALGRVRWDEYVFASMIVLVDVALLGAAGYVTLRRRKFGRSHLELATFPVIGGELVGTIVTSKPIAATSHVYVALLCEERRIAGSRGSDLSMLWQCKHAVDLVPVARMDGGSRIPVEFTIPADCSATTRESPYVTWRVAAYGSMVGIDYYATFRIPVVAARDEMKLPAN
jgi:hypothetical protein